MSDKKKVKEFIKETFSNVTERLTGESLDGENLIFIQGICDNYMNGKTAIYVIKDNGDYVSCVSMFRDGFYSHTFGEVNDIKHLRKLYSKFITGVNFWRDTTNKSYNINTYNIDSSEDFKAALNEMDVLLACGFKCGYNDEGGVGSIEKNEDGTYNLEHHRYGIKSREENIEVGKVANFLRIFFDLGVSRELKENW